MCHNISLSQGLTLVEYCSFTEIYDAGPPRKSDYFLKKLLCYVSRLNSHSCKTMNTRKNIWNDCFMTNQMQDETTNGNCLWIFF